MESPSVNELTELLQFLTGPEKDRLDKLLRPTKASLWLAQIGPQSDALLSPAYELFFGGSGGGGKTSLLCGTALTQHEKALICRREYGDLAEIIDQITECIGHTLGYNSQRNWWRNASPVSKRIDFFAMQHPGDEQRRMGWPHDLKGFDEVSQFTETQYHFQRGWNRTKREGQRCRVIATGNPPMTSDGQWVIKRWAPWLEKNHPNPALSGEIRWYARLGEDDVEVSGPEPIQHNGRLIRPMSRSFIRSRVSDNIYYAGTEYEDVLDTLPEPLRSMIRDGDFTAGVSEDIWQILPDAWVQAAMDRWTMQKPDMRMSALGVDVARGGKAKTVLTPRYGTWFGEQEVYPGAATPSGPVVAALIGKALRDDAPAMIDAEGVGSAVIDACEGLSLPYYTLFSSGASQAKDRTGKFGFMNKRAQWWWQFREALDPDHGDDIAIPDDRELKADLCAVRWKPTMRGIAVEPKNDIPSASGARQKGLVSRLGRSPDKGESLIYASAEAGMTQLTEEHFAVGAPLESAEADWIVPQDQPDWDF